MQPNWRSWQVLLFLISLLVSSAATLPTGEGYSSAPGVLVESGLQRRQDRVCKNEDGTYNGADTPTSEWNIASPKGVFVTIVNMTPYRFVLERVAEYQMNKMDFGDVPPGKSRRCAMVYNGGSGSKNKVDDKGEAYYRLDGTDKKFVIMARTNYGDDGSPWRPRIELSLMGLEAREYIDRGQGRAINLVITGSEAYNTYYSSLYVPPTGWMKEIKDVIGGRRVKHIIMPGSHDAGMSKIGPLTWMGEERNTQNQGLSTLDQLKIGSRWMDIRVIRVDDDFQLAHTNYQTGKGFIMVGATGESLKELIDNINSFNRDNPGEVIFLWMKYFWTVTRKTEVSVEKYRDMSDEELDELFKRFGMIENRCKGFPTKDGNFEEITMETYMKQNNNAGCAMILMDEPHVKKDDPAEGIYLAKNFNRDDNWSEEPEYSKLFPKQIDGWKENRMNAPQDDKFLISQWLTTQKDTTIDIEDQAVNFVNDRLYWDGINGMSPVGFPNVLLLDYIGISYQDQHEWGQADHEIRALVIGLNLYMVSENCGFSATSHPLFRPKVNVLRKVRGVDGPSDSVNMGPGLSKEVSNSSVIRVDNELFSQLKLKVLDAALPANKTLGNATSNDPLLRNGPTLSLTQSGALTRSIAVAPRSATVV